MIVRYFAVPTRLGATFATQNKVRLIIEKFREGRGERLVREIRFEHIDTMVAKKRAKVLVGNRMEGGVEAARKLRKELVRLFDFAVKLRMIVTNPVAQADRIKTAPEEPTKGFHTWTEEQIAQYRAHHALGRNARPTMELMLWTGQRRVDAIRMGRQHIRDGRSHVVQSKNGKELWIPVAPRLLEAIVAMHASSSHLCFLVIEYGKPFSNPGFGNKMREWCDATGLPQCTDHGLRKAIMRRMAELGLAQQTLKSVSGHTRA